VTAETDRLDRLTASDLFLLLWDDYGWSTDIGGLAIFEGTSLLDRDGRVRIEAVRQQVEPRLHLVPRFRQLLYRPRRGLGWPLWVDAPSFDLADHIRVHAVAVPGDEAQLLRHVKSWRGDGSIQPGRCGSCGCCPACRADGWVRS
jgi:diacylglycerol O-acyltransferase / wax synthase